ncbi:MAG TPA: hypothetical protein DCX27_00505 [Balneola sp.]|nr:hypothetical protein [Balneola sp.]
MLDNEVYKRFKANLPAKNFKKLKENAKKIKVSFEVDNLAFVNEWLLQYGNKIKIISPDELISKRKSLLKDMLEKN